MLTHQCRDTRSEISDLKVAGLLINSFELDERIEFGDHHSLLHLHPASEPRAVFSFSLSFLVIPDLTIRAVAVPTKIAIRNRSQRKILKAAQETVLFRYL